MAINENTVALIDELKRTEGGTRRPSRNDSIEQVKIIWHAWSSSSGSEVPWGTTKTALQKNLNGAHPAFGDKLETFLGNLSTDISAQNDIATDFSDHHDSEDLYREYEAYALARFENSRTLAETVQIIAEHWNWGKEAGIWQKYEDGEWKSQVVQTSEGTLALNYERTQWV